MLEGLNFKTFQKRFDTSYTYDQKLKFYQKPIYNYKLECELEEGQSLDSLYANFLNDASQRLFAWSEMLATFQLFGVVVLICNLLLPIVIVCIARRSAWVYFPIMFVVIAGAFIKPLI